MPAVEETSTTEENEKSENDDHSNSGKRETGSEKTEEDKGGRGSKVKPQEPTRSFLPEKLVTIVIIIILLISSITISFYYFSWDDDNGEENHPPNAVIRADKGSVVIGEEIVFNASESTDPDGDELTYSWDFGDDSAVIETMVVVHSYSTSGDFTVTLMVSDGQVSDNTTVIVTVTVDTIPPVADFTIQPPTGDTTTVFQFSDLSTDDGTLVNWSWEFGDGERSFDQEPEHIYSLAGTYTVRLTIRDDDGETNVTEKSVVVEEAEITGPVIINEIMFDPAEPELPGGRADESEEMFSEWVELYNGYESQNLYGWLLTNRADSNVISLPGWVLPADAYLIIDFGSGEHDDDFEDGRGTYYLNPTSRSRDGEGGIDFFHDMEDECALFEDTPGESTILDFMAWSFDGDYTPGDAHGHAVAAEIWEEGDHYHVQPEQNDTIGRDMDSTDSDGVYDWWVHGGVHASLPTPGRLNQHSKIEKSRFPLILQDGWEEDGETTTRFTVVNNVDHEISDFSLTYDVLEESGSLNILTMDVLGEDLFDTMSFSGDTAMKYTWALKVGSSLGSEKIVELICSYSHSQGALVMDSLGIDPEPFADGDINYNQINDHLEEIMEDIEAAGNGSSERIGVTVMLNHTVDQQDIDLFESHGGIMGDVYTIITGFSGNITVAGLRAYYAAIRDSIDFLDPVVPVDRRLDISLPNIRVNQVHTDPDNGFTGDPKTTIAVLDSGIDDSHPFFGTGGMNNEGYFEMESILRGFQDNESIIDINRNSFYDVGTDIPTYEGEIPGIQSLNWTGLRSEEKWENLSAGSIGAKIIGWDDPARSAFDPEDLEGHGTHCAAIASSVAPDARLYSARAENSDQNIAALQNILTVAQDMHITVVSWSGGVARRIAAAERAVRNLVSAGIMLVNAGGNSFADVAGGGQIGPPGEVEEIITVGAVNDQDQITFYSSIDQPGDTVKPDVVAPGGSFIIGSQINSVDSNDVATEPFLDLDNDLIWDGGDLWNDTNRNEHWDDHLDIYLDLNLDETYDPPGEPPGDLDGTAGYQPGGDSCNDTHPSGPPVGDGAFSGEIWFDKNADQQFNIEGLEYGLDNTVEMSGTSMAAPHVAGQYALLVDAITNYEIDDANDDGTDNSDPWNGIDDDGDCRIDNDVKTWDYSKDQALAVKRIILMTAYEVHGGERVPAYLVFDEDGDGNYIPGLDEIFHDVNLNGVYELGTDVVIDDGFPNGVATPNNQNFPAIIQGATPWAGAFRTLGPPNVGASNAPGDNPIAAGPDGIVGNFDDNQGDGITDVFHRGEKDGTEGYGRVCVDAAIEAVTLEMDCCHEEGTLGSPANLASDKKVWARNIELFKEAEYTFELEGPAGADFDLYLYNVHYEHIFKPVPASSSPFKLGNPLRNFNAWRETRRNFSVGEPQILAKGIGIGTANEQFTIKLDDFSNTPRRGIYYVVVKWVNGNGPFTLSVTKKTDWTVIAYMGAQTVQNLTNEAFKDINEMEMVGSNGNMSIIALVDYDSNVSEGLECEEYDEKNTTYVHYIRCDKKEENITSPVCRKIEDLNLGDPRNLSMFIENVTECYPADHYLLDIWGQGYGWKGVLEDTRNESQGIDKTDRDMLYMWELQKALIDSGIHFDIIGFDADFMGMVEVGYQISEHGDIMVASEEEIPRERWPYQRFLSWLGNNSEDSAENFSKVMVDEFHDYYSTEHIVGDHTLSAVFLNPLRSLVTRNIQQFGEDMLAAHSLDEWGLDDYNFGFMNHSDETDNTQIQIMQNLFATERFVFSDYIDLRDFMERIQNDTDIPSAYKEEAPKIFDLLEEDKGIVILEEHGTLHPNANGLSIYFPAYQTSYSNPFGAGYVTRPFDDPWPSCEVKPGNMSDLQDMRIYSLDTLVSWGTSPYMPFGDFPPHPLNETPDFNFTEDTQWDEFLHRYYKPVADAGEDQVVFTDGFFARVTLDGSGSSDADGFVTSWIWDTDAGKDSPEGEQMIPKGDDWDADEIDEMNDDRNAFGETVEVLLPFGENVITLTVWDNHHLELDTYKDYYLTTKESHANHRKTDQDQCIVTVIGKLKEIGTPEYIKEEKSFVTSTTPFQLIDYMGEAEFEVENWIRIKYKDKWSPWEMDDGDIFYLDEECIHDIEYYAKAHRTGQPTPIFTSPIFTNTHYVDNSAPFTMIEFEGPVHEDEENGTFIKSDTKIHLNATDNGTNPCIIGKNKTMYRVWKNGNWTEWEIIEGPLRLDGDGKRFLEFKSDDLLGNEEEIKNITVIVDDTPPKTKKSVGEPQDDDGKWVTFDSEFSFDAEDKDPSGEHDGVGTRNIFSRIYSWGGWTPWTLYRGPFTLWEGTDFLEFYAEDYLGNMEKVQNQTHHVDYTPPVTVKEISDPKYQEGLWITSDSEIGFSAADYFFGGFLGMLPGVGLQFTVYRVKFEGEWSDWTLYESEFSFDEDGEYTIEFHSKDRLGNEEMVADQIHHVDTAAPESTEEVGDPNSNGGYTVSPETPIWLNATDSDANGDNGSGVQQIYYEVWWDSNGNGTVDTKVADDTVENDTVEINLENEGINEIRWYGVDNLGNVEELHTSEHEVTDQ